MFKFLKDKLKGALSTFSKKAEDEAPEEIVEVEKKPEPIKEAPAPETSAEPGQKKGFLSKIFRKKEDDVEAIAKELEEIEQAAPEPAEEPAIIQEPPAEEKPAPAPKEEPLPELNEEPAPREPATVEEKTTPQEEPLPELKEEHRIIEEPPAPKPEPLPEIEEEPPRPIKKKEPPAKERPHPPEKPAPKQPEPEAQKRGFFAKLTEKITTKKISGEQFDELFWDLELALLENNVAVEVIEKIKNDLKAALVDQPIPRGKVEEAIAHSLISSVRELFDTPSTSLLERAAAAKKEGRPLVVCFVGINGSGKTTTIAKVTRLLQSKGYSVVLAAADTFRAAAIDQLQLHADRLGVKLIKHDYGADAAAVAFDAVQHAKAKQRDVVLIDTAGRLHSNANLMDEMRKIVRVAKPDMKIFVGESITGNDCVEQAKKFDEIVGLDGIILAKADIDEKGGAALSISYVTKKPILYMGMGQEYEDLKPFDPSLVVGSLGLEA